jgi:Winged helix-turn helix
MVRLSYQGWDKVSLSQFFRISRPTVDRWIARFETEHCARLMDHKRGPQSPRKMWLPVMVAVDSSPKAPSRCRRVASLDLLARPALSVRTVGRIMALNKRVYDDIPHVRNKGPKPTPQFHPYKRRPGGHASVVLTKRAQVVMLSSKIPRFSSMASDILAHLQLDFLHAPGTKSLINCSKNHSARRRGYGASSQRNGDTARTVIRKVPNIVRTFRFGIGWIVP